MNTFEQLGLTDFISKAIEDLKFTEPSAIQFEAIPHLMAGEDIIAMAPTGSGKTFAFGIPALQKIDSSSNKIQALILCPTRELAIQAHKELEKLSKYNEDIKMVSIYGGQAIDRQINALKRKPQVIIATPGRLMDHLRQGFINLENLSYIVLDEADEMLDMGFREDIHTILEQTNENHQTVLFSATMEKEIKKIAKTFQKSPIIIDVLDNLQSIPDIEQFYFEVNEKEKSELILRLFELHNLSSALVFCNTKSSVDLVVEILKRKGLLAEPMHGDMNQSQREKVLQSFRNGAVKILVATDVAGRGIDIKNIGAVFNYDLPRDEEDYVHRIGRTGRAGTSGVAFSLVTRNQAGLLKKIERANGIKINKHEKPSIDEIEKSRINVYKNRVLEIISSDDLSEFKKYVKDIKAFEVSDADIAAALYKLIMDREPIKINKELEFKEVEFDYSMPSRKRDGSRGRRRFGRRGGSSENRDSRDNRARGERHFGKDNKSKDAKRSDVKFFSKSKKRKANFAK